MRPAIVFLDDGGVLNDNERRAAGWRRLIGEFLSPRLGGAPEAWGEANRVVFAQQWERFEEWARSYPGHGDVDFFASREERVRWLAEMCGRVGVAPLDEDACYELSVETERYVVPRVRAAYPEAADAVRALHRAGHSLSTASGTRSHDLDRILAAMSVGHYFSRPLYGPDLVGTPKASPEFYRRIFADAGVAASDALIVDDAPQAIAWAAQAGTRTVHVRRGDAPEAPDAHRTVRDLLELVELLS